MTKQQLEDVLDPLSAAFLHTQNGNSVCDDTLPVFDGRLRFDLVLAPKRVEDLPSEAPKGLPGSVEVCQVKFVPVSGHKPDNAVISFLSKTDRLEAWLVRLPETRALCTLLDRCADHSRQRVGDADPDQGQSGLPTPLLVPRTP